MSVTADEKTVAHCFVMFSLFLSVLRQEGTIRAAGWHHRIRSYVRGLDNWQPRPLQERSLRRRKRRLRNAQPPRRRRLPGRRASPRRRRARPPRRSAQPRRPCVSRPRKRSGPRKRLRRKKLFARPLRRSGLRKRLRRKKPYVRLPRRSGQPRRRLRKRLRRKKPYVRLLLRSGQPSVRRLRKKLRGNKQLKQSLSRAFVLRRGGLAPHLTTVRGSAKIESGDHLYGGRRFLFSACFRSFATLFSKLRRRPNLSFDSPSDSGVVLLHIASEDGDGIVQIGQDSFDRGFTFRDDFIGPVELEEPNGAEPRGDVDVGWFASQA